MHAVLRLLTLVGIQLTLNSIAIQTGALSPEVPLHLRQAMLHELPHLWKLLPLKPLRSAGVVLHSAALPSVRHGASGPRKNTGPRPNSPPRPVAKHPMPRPV